MEDNKKILTTLVGVILLLTLVNVFGTYTLYSKFASISGALPKTSPEGSSPSPDSNQPEPSQNVQVSSDDDPVKGLPEAPVTIIEFSDFQCPFCARFVQETMPQIEEKYIKTGKVKLVFRDYPLPFHENAQKASEATECADEQGKFWEMHDKLFANQTALAANDLKKYAKELGLDTAKFNTCLDSGQMADEVKKDFNDASQAGVEGTPTFFVNGTKIVGAQPFGAFEQAIEEALKK